MTNTTNIGYSTWQPHSYGWICPRCNRVWAPTTAQCYPCAPTYYTYPSTGTYEPNQNIFTSTAAQTTSGSDPEAWTAAQSGTPSAGSETEAQGAVCGGLDWEMFKDIQAELNKRP